VLFFSIQKQNYKIYILELRFLVFQLSNIEYASFSVFSKNANVSALLSQLLRNSRVSTLNSSRDAAAEGFLSICAIVLRFAGG